MIPQSLLVVVLAFHVVLNLFVMIQLVQWAPKSLLLERVALLSSLPCECVRQSIPRERYEAK